MGGEGQIYPCIRCGECAAVCPHGLQPQALYNAARVGDAWSLMQEQLVSCSECGQCSTVCPSNIPLTDWLKAAKHELLLFQSQRQAAPNWLSRYRARSERLSRPDQDREQSYVDFADKDQTQVQLEIAAAIKRRRRAPDQIPDSGKD